MSETIEISFNAYGAMWNAGYHVGFNALPDANPCHPKTLEYEGWEDGRADGAEQRAIRCEPDAPSRESAMALTGRMHFGEAVADE